MSSNAQSCGLKLGAFFSCVCVSLVFLFSSIFLFWCLSLGPCLSRMCAHTTPPSPSSFVFVLLCLVSIRSERVKGWGPLIPLGTTRGSEYQRGSSQWGLLIALRTSERRLFLSFWDMCSDMQYALICTNNNIRRTRTPRCTGLRRVSLFVVSTSSSGDVTSSSVYCCTFLGRDYKYTQRQEHVGPPCLCVYVWWLSHNLGCLFNSQSGRVVLML